LHFSRITLLALDEGERAFQEQVLSGPPPLGPGAAPLERLIAYGQARVSFLLEYRDIARAALDGRQPIPAGSQTPLSQVHIRVLLGQMDLGPVNLDILAVQLTAALDGPLLFYLSAAVFESQCEQNNYTEKLVPLAGLGVCYDALEVANEDLDIGALGIDASLPTIVCPGTPFKYTAAHDRVFVEVARRLGRCQFLLFKHPRGKLSAQLMGRLRTAFSQAGMNVDEYFVEVPWLSRPHFYSLLRQADLYMDTIGFSGFNSAMQAVECGLPVVTREGKFMRGRFASGILRALELPELVAESDDAYAELIVRIASDKAMRGVLRDRLARGRSTIFNTVEPVHSLERFIEEICA